MSSSTNQFQTVPDWAARAAGRLITPLRVAKIDAFVRALGQGAQLHEDVTFDLLVSTGLYEAGGDALDQWGELVGEARGPLLDAEYLPFILARMLVNRSGTSGSLRDDGMAPIDQILQIFDIVTEPNAGVWHHDNFPSGFYLGVDRIEFMSDERRRRVARLMEDARPAGRHMTLIESLVGGFGFEEDDTAEGFDVGPFSRLIVFEE